MSPLMSFLFFFPIFLLSLTFHEAAHAWTANKLGDPTAKMLGRLTLNPIAHIDWIGTVLFPLLSTMIPGLMLIGWAKPVPVTVRNFKNIRRDDFLVSFAGPLSNIALGLVLTGMLYALPALSDSFQDDGHWASLLNDMLLLGVFLNFRLAFFNLLPLPPLDGSHMFGALLPAHWAYQLDRLGSYSFLIMYGLLYMGLLKYLLAPATWLALKIIP